MKRSPFRRPAYEPAPAPPLVPLRKAPNYASASVPVPVPKVPRELEPGDETRLWAHVRGLPCARCWTEGRTQVSHSNALLDGKGRGIKAYPWRVAALCVECHALIDQGKDMTRAERQAAWESAHRWTVGELFSRSLVRPV
jgi:hypothetical protein